MGLLLPPAHMMMRSCIKEDEVAATNKKHASSEA